MTSVLRHANFTGFVRQNRGFELICVMNSWRNPGTRKMLRQLGIRGLGSVCRNQKPVGCINSRLLLKRQKLTTQGYLLCGPLSTRLNSTVEATKTGDFLPPPADYIPEPPPIPEPVLPIEPVLNALGEPTFTSLGLGGYWPSGLVQSGLEMLHVSGGLPWFAAIAVGTVIIRCCMFPLVIKSQKNAAKMHNHMPTIQRLQAKFTEARQQNNAMDAARYGNEMVEYMKRNDVKVMRNFLVPLAQVPVFISVFYGLRAMANLPIESMKTGGLFWFTDLSIPDPFYVLPIITMLTFLVTIELGVDSGMKLSTQSFNMKWMFRCIPIIMVPVMINFPAAMLCYWLTSNTFSLVQVSVLKIPGLRDKLGIERLVKHDNAVLAPKKPFIKGFKDSWENAKINQQMKERERLNEMKFKKAGVGAVPKTYKYDPTKPRGSKTKDEFKWK
ncbi:unnamed protein product [Owenia fusiformis]|uniref:Membrane insertase YidC/Oxa/ALB C-terminal domain-containing protein n=1 Tax=Owenia fusiformis TaxID=6347 RepID=A0A8S4NFP2_OWEFU|nr:unnamed protein product [Owenia fusiformis]